MRMFISSYLLLLHHLYYSYKLLLDISKHSQQINSLIQQMRSNRHQSFPMDDLGHHVVLLLLLVSLAVLVAHWAFLYLVLNHFVHQGPLHT